MKKYKNILNQLKGEFTIKDLKTVVREYKPMGYWGKIQFCKKNSKIHTPNSSRKEFDKWVIKFMQQKNIINKSMMFFLILENKARKNMLFVEPLNFTDMEEIEKNIKKFLLKFKKNYTKKFLEEEIKLFMPYDLVYDFDKSSLYYQYDYNNYRLEKEPFGLKKKEFNVWIINQIKNFYENNLFINEYDIYIQFFLAFIKRAKFEIQNNVMVKVLKKFKNKFTIKTLIKTMYKFYKIFIDIYLHNDKKEISSKDKIKYNLEQEKLYLSKNFNVWIIKQAQNYRDNIINYQMLPFYFEGEMEGYYVFFFLLLKKITYEYKKKLIKKKDFIWNYKKMKNYKKIKNYSFPATRISTYFSLTNIHKHTLEMNLEAVLKEFDDKIYYFSKEKKKTKKF